MVYKRSSKEDIIKRNMEAYLGDKKIREADEKKLKEWLKK